MISVPYTIKNLYHQDHCYKNIRIHFPNGERTDICNNLIVKDSVSFTESLCSQNTLKFGLCESPIFECEVVGVGNIKGATIEVSVEIECPFSASGAEWKADLQKYVYSIPYGTFVVDSCRRQADMNHRKIVAYAGFATRRWEIAESEKHKAGRAATGTTYTPNIAMFYLANGFNTLGNLLDETSVSTSSHWERDSVYSTSYISYDCIMTGRWNTISYPNTSNEIYQFEKPNYLINATKLKDEMDKFFGNEILSLYGDSAYKSYVISQQRIFDRIYQGMGITIEREGNVEYPSYYSAGIEKPLYAYDNTQSNKHEVHLFEVTSVYFREYSQQSVIRQSDTYVLTEDTPVLKKYTYINDAPTWTTYNYTFHTSAWSSGLGMDVIFDIDLQEALPSFVELTGCFLKTYRDESTALVNLKRLFHMSPGSDLYPSTDLYPQGVTGGTLQPKDYQSCWYDDEYTTPYGLVKCTYKNALNEQIEYSYYFQGFSNNDDPKSYKTYDLSDNLLIKSNVYTESEIQSICAYIANELTGLSWMPVEFVGRGLPYVESGDTFEILTKSNDSITTIVLNRTLTGEMTLKDTYKSV